MTLLVFGKTGQVALEMAALAPDAVFLGRDQADLSDPEACADAIWRITPTAVINAAAYTAVDAAETDEEMAARVNGAAPGAMAEVCAQLDIPFVQISTDYVFDGAGEAPFEPADATAPLGAYGRTKLAGEAAVKAEGGRFAILRTSWVFSAHGKNFLKTMLRLSETRDALTVVADQIGGPTPARAIAEACLSIAEQLKAAPQKAGVYHFSGAPEASWADFARVIFDAAGRNVAVTDLTTAEYPTPAKRPLNSRLDCSATEATFGIAQPDWRAATQEIVAQLMTEGAAA